MKKENFAENCYVYINICNQKRVKESTCSDAHPHVRIRLTALIHPSIYPYTLSTILDFEQFS